MNVIIDQPCVSFWECQSTSENFLDFAVVPDNLTKCCISCILTHGVFHKLLGMFLLKGVTCVKTFKFKMNFNKDLLHNSFEIIGLFKWLSCDILPV